MSIRFVRNVPSEHNEENATFLRKVSDLPSALKKHFLGYLFVCVVVVAVTVAMLLYFQDLRFCAGFLIALYLAYMGLDIVWAYDNGTLICQRMICIKAAKHPMLNCLDIMCQEVDAGKPMEERIHQFYVANSPKNKIIFTKNTVMDIYYRPTSPTEMTAWTILGYRAETK